MKIDLRIIKTKKSIYEAFIKLLEKSSFEDLKVSDICKLAMINRSTFYSHFDDKYVLLNSFINDLKDNLREELNKNINITNSKEYYMEIIKLLLEHIDSKKDIYKTLMLNNKNSIAIDMIYNTLKEDILSKMNNSMNNETKIPNEFIYNFYIGATLNVIMKWISDDSLYSKEDIVKYLDILIPVEE